VNHLTEEQLVGYHYGDSGDHAEAAAVEEHLHACASCQADFTALRRSLETIDALQTPERGESYGAEVWARLQPKLEPAPSGWQALVAWLTPRRLVLAGGLAVVVLAAFVAGRFVPGLTSKPATPASVAAGANGAGAQTTAADRQQVRERILLVAVGDHLERSQVALVELVNNPGGAHVDISEEQQRARDLVTENRLYRQTALTTGDTAVASVLDDLERSLVEIANSPSTLTDREFTRVRERIEQQGIIFKVRVFGERVREREDNAQIVNASSRGGI
jgi:hypothetical protein